MEGPNRRPRVRFFRIGILLIWIICAELIAFATGRFLQSKWMMYSDPRQPEATRHLDFTYSQYLEERDPILGWPYPSEMGSGVYAQNGSLRSPANDRLHQSRASVSLYGDSYVAGRNVPLEKSWDNQLANLLGLRVDNFGVGGYGTDQAVLRFFNNLDDGAKVVVFGHMSEDIMRNLTRYRDFQVFERWFAFKPRFVMNESGDAALIPLPTLSEEEYARFLDLKSPQLVLSDENFHPNGPSGAVRLRFPYTLSVLKNLRYWRFAVALRSVIKGVPEPDYMEFYDPEHPFEGLQITRSLLAEFNRECERRGKHALIVLFPSPRSMDYYRSTGTWTYQPLEDALGEGGIEVWNFGETIAAYMRDRDYAEAYARHHFVQEIYDLLAKEMYAKFRDRRWF